METLLPLLDTGDLAAWAASTPDAALALVAGQLCATPPTASRKAHLAALRHYLRVPRRYSALLAAWGGQCSADFAHFTQRWPTAARLLPAHIHLVQEESGSGILLSPTLVLTCAHCVCDASGEEEEEEAEAAGRRRLGRSKVLLLPSGGYVTATCAAVDEGMDLALLRITAASPLLAQVVHFPTVCAAPAAGPVVCVGNPSAYDLESSAVGATHFQPPLFHTSKGKVVGPTDAKRRQRLGLGALHHTAWTYWGHSGAPLINARGELCALHNTWDGSKGTRHGVSAAQIAEFVARHAPGVPVAAAPVAAPAAAAGAAAVAGGGGGAPASAAWELPEDAASAGGGSGSRQGVKRKR